MADFVAEAVDRAVAKTRTVFTEWETACLQDDERMVEYLSHAEKCATRHPHISQRQYFIAALLDEFDEKVAFIFDTPAELIAAAVWKAKGVSVCNSVD